jgi:hypothetical protein
MAQQPDVDLVGENGDAAIPRRCAAAASEPAASHVRCATVRLRDW